MDVNELTVMPCVTPLCVAVTMVTPVVQARMAARSCSGSRVIKCVSNNIYHNGDEREGQDKNSGDCHNGLLHFWGLHTIILVSHATNHPTSTSQTSRSP